MSTSYNTEFKLRLQKIHDEARIARGLAPVYGSQISTAGLAPDPTALIVNALNGVAK